MIVLPGVAGKDKIMGLNQDDSVLNCNSNAQNKALPQPGTLCPFPVNLGDVFLKSNNSTNPDFNQSQSLNMGPGLYAIVCGKSGKVYFGESGNVVQRIGSHYAALAGGRHECEKLQEDWSTHGDESFSFLSLSVGKQWEDRALRRQAEDLLITLNPQIVYNLSIAGSTPKNNLIITKNRLVLKVLYILVSLKQAVKLLYQKAKFVVWFVTKKTQTGSMLVTQWTSMRSILLTLKKQYLLGFMAKFIVVLVMRQMPMAFLAAP